MKKKYAKIFVFAFGILLLLGAIPRGIEVLNHNYLFGFDQGLFYESVRKIVVEHKPTLVGTEVGGIGGFFQGPGWYYLLAIAFIFTGGDPYGGIVLMFIISLAALSFSYLLFKKVFGNITALSIAFFVAVSPVIIQQARSIWPPYPVTLLTVVFLYCFYKFLSGKQKYLPLAVFVIGLMSHFEIATSGTMLLQLVLFSPLLFYPKKIIQPRIIIVAILAFAASQVLFLLFEARHGFIGIKGIYQLFSVGGVKNTYQFVIANHYDVFRSTIVSVLPGNTTVNLIIIVIGLVGSFLYLRDKKNNYANKLFLIYLLVGIPLLFIVFLGTRLGIWSWWIYEIPVFMCFVYGIIIGYFFKSSNLFKKILALGIIIWLSIIFMGYTIAQYKHDYNDYGGDAKIKGKEAVIDFIYHDANGKKFGLLIFSPPVYTYPYDYLLNWYAQKKYGYKPDASKDGTFYLLIQVDPYKPWSYNGWLETIVKSGKIEKTVKLPSGFIVQKRTGNLQNKQ